MEILAYKEAQKIWKRIARNKEAPETELAFELALHKKLLQIFQVGPFYYYIFNCSIGEIEYTSESVSQVLGILPHEFTIPYALRHLHPEDLPYFINFENKVTEFFNQLPAEKVPNYKVSYDYRLQKVDKEYVRILHQVVTIQTDEQGSVLRTLGIHTDITQFKPHGYPVLSFFGLEGEPSYLNVDVKKVFAPSREQLTLREKQVLAALMAGNQSKEIATLLCISKQTVDKHRKNMLSKTGVRSTPELVALAIKEGWL